MSEKYLIRKKSIKICFLANGDASDVFTQMWIDYFAKKYSVILITDNKPHGIACNVEVYYIKWVGKNQFIGFVLKVRKLIKKINPDVIYALSLNKYGLIGALSGFHPFFASPYGSDIATYPDRSVISKYIIKYVLKKADIIQVQDPLSADRIISLGTSSKKIHTIPWGANINLFRPTDMEKEYDVINIHGNSFTQHDVATFIKSLPTVINRYPNVRYILLGNKQPAYKLAKKIGVLDNIIFGGFINHKDIPFYICQSKIFVDCFYPSHNHGGHTYGVAVHEAMACGIPTILANRPTVNQLIGKDKWHHGKTFVGGNYLDLAEKIIELLDSKEERNRISVLNRKIIEKKFDWNKNIISIEKMIIKNYRGKNQ